MKYEYYASCSIGTSSARYCNGFHVRLALGPSLGDAAILCNLNIYVSCKASTIAFMKMMLALRHEILVRLHVALGPNLEMLQNATMHDFFLVSLALRPLHEYAVMLRIYENMFLGFPQCHQL